MEKPVSSWCYAGEKRHKCLNWVISWYILIGNLWSRMFSFPTFMYRGDHTNWPWYDTPTSQHNPSAIRPHAGFSLNGALHTERFDFTHTAYSHCGNNLIYFLRNLKCLEASVGLVWIVMVFLSKFDWYVIAEVWLQKNQKHTQTEDAGWIKSMHVCQ